MCPLSNSSPALCRPPPSPARPLSRGSSSYPSPRHGADWSKSNSIPVCVKGERVERDCYSLAD